MDDGKSIRYKDLHALFEQILEKTMRQEQRDWGVSPVCVWVNTFKVFLDEFMTEYKPLHSTMNKVLLASYQIKNIYIYFFYRISILIQNLLALITNRYLTADTQASVRSLYNTLLFYYILPYSSFILPMHCISISES